MSESLTVALGERSYPILIGHGLLKPGVLDAYIAGSQVAIVTNATVAPLYLAQLRSALQRPELQVDAIILPDGEAHKNLASYGHVLDELMRLRHNRSTTLIALGGGVIGDITGFVAATYQRGVAFIQVPTTLLAQVDSSVGGKTAVNHPLGKNMIGAFYQPKAVLADTAVLGSLPQREYLAGIAEVIKYGVIQDAAFFIWLEREMPALLAKSPQQLAHAIVTSCACKAQVVAADERESGLRAILNFGHTFGHAIEALTNYQQFLHGEAVAIGMVMAADLSWRLGLLDQQSAQRIRHLVAQAGLPVQPPQISAEDFLAAMGMDKKVQDGRMRFVVAQGIGQAQVTDQVPAALLLQTLAAYEKLCAS